MPSEKEIPIPEQLDTPSMGALPVDSIGSTKPGAHWKSQALDETHENTGENMDKNIKDEDEIISTGVGPDPEHTDN